MHKIQKIFLAFLAAWLLVGCTPDSPVDFPPLTFVRYQPIHIDVSNIEIIDDYKSPLKSPYVEHLFPYSPAEAMRIWVKDRLRAVGGDKTLQVIIKDGSVVSVPITKNSQLQEWIALNRDKRYDAKLDVELRIYGPNSALSLANVTVAATRSVTISEKATVSQRDFLYRQMIAELMETINAELEKNIFLYMGNHISFSQSP